MTNTLIDAGPLIALFDKSDQFHDPTIRFLKDFRGNFLTTWPVITEVSHMLDFSTRAQIDFLTWIERGGLKVIEIDSSYLDRIIALTEKFSDVPMDLADATLVVASETLGIKEIVSLDADLYIYRDVRNNYLTNIFKTEKG